MYVSFILEVFINCSEMAFAGLIHFHLINFP